MNNEGTVYFIGAGASKQDQFPLTGELKHGIAWAILKNRPRFELLAYQLKYLFHVSDDTLEKSAQIWETLCEQTDEQSTRCQIPNVTDLLSMLDWIIREQSSFGPGLHFGDPKSSSPIDELPAVRDLIVQALCFSLAQYHEGHPGPTTCDFIKRIRPADSMITTNWDLLLDATRHRRFGSKADDYGTTGSVELAHTDITEGNGDGGDGPRPKLLKLHGSLSWRYCQRCQRLVIDPLHHVAGEREKQAVCICNYKYSELIVTPGFIREYRNVHLLNIWREALETLVLSSHWVFIGYSLPADDVGIRTLLLKARCVRKDVNSDPPRVTIVTGDHGDETRARYEGIFSKVELFYGKFGDFVGQMNATA